MLYALSAAPVRRNLRDVSVIGDEEGDIFEDDASSQASSDSDCVTQDATFKSHESKNLHSSHLSSSHSVSISQSIPIEKEFDYSNNPDEYANQASLSLTQEPLDKGESNVKRDPSFVPRSGLYFIHDDRNDQSQRSRTPTADEPVPKATQLRTSRTQRTINGMNNVKKWQHDKFEEITDPERQTRQSNRAVRNTASEHGYRRRGRRGRYRYRDVPKESSDTFLHDDSTPMKKWKTKRRRGRYSHTRRGFQASPIEHKVHAENDKFEEVPKAILDSTSKFNRGRGKYFRGRRGWNSGRRGWNASRWSWISDRRGRGRGAMPQKQQLSHDAATNTSLD